jgi:hypothetical protein
MRALRKALLSGVVLALGCATAGPRSAEERAAQARTDEQRMCAGAPATDLAAFAPPNIERVEPILFVIQHGRGNREEQVRGVRLYLRPQPGMSAPLVERTLVCHRARRLVGAGEPELPNEPWVLPAGWVDVTVAEGAGDFIVSLRGIEPRDGEEALARARAFAAR